MPIISDRNSTMMLDEPELAKKWKNFVSVIRMFRTEATMRMPTTRKLACCDQNSTSMLSPNHLERFVHGWGHGAGEMQREMQGEVWTVGVGGGRGRGHGRG